MLIRNYDDERISRQRRNGIIRAEVEKRGVTALVGPNQTAVAQREVRGDTQGDMQGDTRGRAIRVWDNRRLYAVLRKG